MLNTRTVFVSTIPCRRVRYVRNDPSPAARYVQRRRQNPAFIAAVSLEVLM